SFAEYCLVADEDLMDIPEGISAATAMPFGIAGLAAWTGLEWKGKLSEGETVLILGASSIVGQIGVQVARRLGAGRVVAAARDEGLLARCVELGADATVRLGGDREEVAAAMVRRRTAASTSCSTCSGPSRSSSRSGPWPSSAG
ncbi:MAG: hypothetical protein AB7T48_06590, partial [Solirubrobacterales bacterium]